MRERRRPSEVRQVELADAALRLIASKGIAALSTRALADEVGLTTGAIFRHFSTIDAVLEAVVERVEAVLEATFPDEALPPLARLEAFIEARSTAVADQLGILRLVLSEQFQLALPRKASARLAACVEKTRTFLVSCVRQAQRDGALRDDVAPAEAARIVMGTIQMVAFDAGASSRRAASTVLQLLKAPPAGRGGSS